MERSGKSEVNSVKNIIKAKRLEKNVTIAEIAKAVGKNPTFVAAALNGNHRFTLDEAKKVGAMLELDSETTAALSKFPVRTDYPNASDPFKYRLMEIIGVYGDSLRDQANEMFGDGIMSAIDFTMDVEREKDPKGDRIKVTMSGKFLPYKIW